MRASLRHSEAYNELRRFWFRKVFWGLMALGFVAVEAYLIFGKSGGFSNTNDKVALTVERVMFGSMFLLPILMPVWAFLCFIVCTVGLNNQAKKQGVD